MRRLEKNPRFIKKAGFHDKNFFTRRCGLFCFRAIHGKVHIINKAKSGELVEEKIDNITSFLTKNGAISPYRGNKNGI